MPQQSPFQVRATIKQTRIDPKTGQRTQVGPTREARMHPITEREFFEGDSSRRRPKSPRKQGRLASRS